MNATNKVAVSRVLESRWNAHINFLINLPMKEGIFNIELVHGPAFNRSNRNKDADGVHFGDGSKCLVIINPVFLSKSFGHKTSLISVNGSTRVVFDGKYPPTPNGFLPGR